MRKSAKIVKFICSVFNYIVCFFTLNKKFIIPGVVFVFILFFSLVVKAILFDLYKCRINKISKNLVVEECF